MNKGIYRSVIKRSLQKIYGIGLIIAGIAIATSSFAQDQKDSVNKAGMQQQQLSADSGTKVVLIGTGNPGIDPDHSGPATAVTLMFIELIACAV